MKYEKMYTTTVFSNRMYETQKQIMDSEFVDVCNQTMVSYQKAVFAVYNLLYLKEFKPTKYEAITNGYKSTYLYVKDKFGFDVYYTNSIINTAKGILDSQIAVNKDYIEQKKESIKTIEEKINKKQKFLDNYLLLRDNLKSYEQKLQEKPNTKIHIKSIKNLSFLPDKVIVRFGINKQKEYGYGAFEYQYLNIKIHNLKKQIHQHKYRVHNIENKIQNRMEIKHIFFRRNIINEIHKENDVYRREKLQKEFLNSKYYRFQVSGIRCQCS